MPDKPPIHLKNKLARVPYKWNDKRDQGADGAPSFIGNRKAHGEGLLTQLRSAEEKIEQSNFTELAEDYLAEKGFVLTFKINSELKPKLETFESISGGVELLNVKLMDQETDDPHMEATVFIAHGKLDYFISRLTGYVENDKNKDFIDPIAEIGLATIESLWTSQSALPEEGSPFWWEVWVRRGPTEDTRKANVNAVKAECAKLELKVNKNDLTLPEHTVLLIEAEKGDLAKAYGILNCVAELRYPPRAKLANSDLFELTSQDINGIVPPPSPEETAPSVCVLDTGVNRAHPLLEPLCAEEYCSSFDVDWGVADDVGHGTQMCGLAAHGDLRDIENGELEATHWIESVKLLKLEDPHKPENYGAATVACMGRIEAIEPNRSNRVFSMAVTARNAPDFPDLCPDGLPTSWSAAIDEATVSALDSEGNRRIFVISGGNVTGDDTDGYKPENYPQTNHDLAFDDPAHSWNAITVGAITHYESDLIPTIAEKGALSPSSRTTSKWIENGGADCPLKPEVVFEGGNVATEGSPIRDELQPISLNHNFLTEPPLRGSNATSAATALAARMSAQIHAEFPDLWPETVRALLINSARWNSVMRDGVNFDNKGDVTSLVRTYGYGEPNLSRAISGGKSHATFFYEEEIQPFHKENGLVKTKEMLYFQMPVPKSVLEGHGNSKVKLHVTLSYFIEPNPGRRGLAKSKFRYANCGLRFDLKTATESIDTFIGNRSGDVLDKLNKDKGDRGDPARGWLLGRNNQGRGSLHHDIWKGRASDLASRDGIMVYPENGWWRLRKHLKRWDSKQRFSLVVTLEVEDDSIDIYTAVENEVENLTVPQRVTDIQSMFETNVEVEL